MMHVCTSKLLARGCGNCVAFALAIARETVDVLVFVAIAAFEKAADLYRSHEHTQRAQIVHFWRLRIALFEHSPDQPLRLGR